MATPRDVLAANRADARRIAEKSGNRALYRIMVRAEADLAKRLARVAPDAKTFGATELRTTLAQVRAVVRQLVIDMPGIVVEAGELSAEAAGEHTVEYLKSAEKAFTGIARPLGLDEGAMMDAAVAGTKASVLRRLLVEDPNGRGVGIVKRYGYETVGWFENELSSGVVSRKSFGDMREALVEKSPFLKEAPASWATRIVRTETAGAYARGAHAAMAAANEEVGGFVRILAATFDERTGADSYNVHGQIRRMEEPFEYVQSDGKREQFLTPPNRPNDREIVVAHRLNWPIPAYLRPKTTAEVQARYAHFKQKFHGRPKMSTVPASSFAKGKWLQPAGNGILRTLRAR